MLRQLFPADIALTDSHSQASRAVKHLLQGRDGGCRISEQFIQGRERGVVNFTQDQAMLHHHVIPFPPIYRDLTGHFYMFKHRSAVRYVRCTSPRVLSRYMQAIWWDLKLVGQKKSGRLRCSPTPSLWLRSRAQQRLRAHLYSWRSAACTSSNVLSLLRRKTDTPWAGGRGGGGGHLLSFLVILLPLVDSDTNLSVCARVARVAAYAICNTGNWLA